MKQKQDTTRVSLRRRQGYTPDGVQLPERRCKRCPRMLGKRIVRINGVDVTSRAISGSSVTQIQGEKCVEILDEIQCPKCGYKNFFHDKY